MAMSKYNISVLFDVFLPSDSVDISVIWMGMNKPSNPYDIPVTPRGWFGVGLCWDLGMCQAII